jgi:hypothetical protein
MRLQHVALAFVVALTAIPVEAFQPSHVRPHKKGISKEAAESLRETLVRLRFAPMWMTVPRFLGDIPPKTAARPPVAIYAIVWQPEWQDDLGLSDQQRKSLAEVHAKAAAEVQKQNRELQKLSLTEKRAKMKEWGGKISPERRALEGKVRQEIEAILTLEQLKTVRDYLLPEQIVAAIYDAKVREEIGLSPEQEGQFRAIVKEKLGQFQEVLLDRSEKFWAVLTPQQKTAFQEIVKHQDEGAEVLAVAWELGFDFSNAAPGYPMLGEAPVRKRLALSAEQEKQIDAIAAEAAARQKARQQRTLGGASSEPAPDSAWEGEAKKRVETILTPAQLAMLNDIDLRRQVTLAFAYTEKRKEAGATEQQFNDYKRLIREAHKPMYEMDRKMLARAVDVLTPAQKDKVQAILDRRTGQ